MENQHSDQTKVLSMNISCCEGCPKILKKKLLKMPGVDSISIDTEKNLVLVTGPVDAMTLLNKVAKLGKRVQLLPNDEHYSNNNNNIHFNEKQNDTRSNQDRDNYNDPTARQNGKMERNWSSFHDSRHRPKKNEKKEEEHKCEPYEPPKVDERACRDFYCKVHPRGMHKIVDKVPVDGSSSLFGGFPFYGDFGPYSTGSYLRPGWYGEEPPLPPQQFGYRRPPPRMLPHPFGFQ